MKINPEERFLLEVTIEKKKFINKQWVYYPLLNNSEINKPTETGILFYPLSDVTKIIGNISNFYNVLTAFIFYPEEITRVLKRSGFTNKEKSFPYYQLIRPIVSIVPPIFQTGISAIYPGSLNFGLSTSLVDLFTLPEKKQQAKEELIKMRLENQKTVLENLNTAIKTAKNIYPNLEGDELLTIAMHLLSGMNWDAEKFIENNQYSVKVMPKGILHGKKS